MHVEERPIHPAAEYASLMPPVEIMAAGKKARPHSARKSETVRNLNESMTSLSTRNAGINEPTTKIMKAMTKKHNRKEIKNALLHVSLAGSMSRTERDELNAILDAEPEVNHTILFKGVLGRTDYRALYRQEYDEHDDLGHIAKVHGAPGAPPHITANMI